MFSLIKNGFLFILITVSFLGTAQELGMSVEFTGAPVISSKKLKHNFYKEFIELIIRQRVDHFGKDTSTFNQKIIIGIRDQKAPVLLVTEGYAVGYVYKEDWENEVARILDANVLVVEQRYTGSSLPNDTVFRFLSMNQIAADYNYIFDFVQNKLKGKLFVTGISKGGQSSLAFMSHYPGRAEAAILFGTPMRNEPDDGRINVFLLNKSSGECGQKLLESQQVLFSAKKEVINYIEDKARESGLRFNMNLQVLADHMILELGFSFWQLCASCNEIPSREMPLMDHIEFMMKIVPMRFYSFGQQQKLAHAYFLGATQLGYYKYNKERFARFLSNGSISTNDLITVEQSFDPKFMNEAREYVRSHPDEFIFLYGENDPYSSLSPDHGLVYKIANKCHRVTIADLPSKDQKKLRSILLRKAGVRE